MSVGYFVYVCVAMHSKFTFLFLVMAWVFSEPGTRLCLVGDWASHCVTAGHEQEADLVRIMGPR